MKALETLLFTAALVAVPLLSWIAGRAMGRRDWKIGAVVVISGLVVLVPHVARLLILGVFDARGLAPSMMAQIERAGQSPEVGFFFLTLGVFMTMLGWTSTPVDDRT